MTERIARVELYHFAYPLPATFYPSWIPGFPQTENRCTLVRIITTGGVEGWSAGPALARERRGLGDLLGPYLLGEVAGVGLIQQRLREMSYLGWRNWWIEPAIWDIVGKIEDKPVCALLGAGVPAVRVYASTGQLRTPPELIARAEAHRDEGFDTIKLRVHEDEATDEQVVRETTAAVGAELSIGVDANQAWRVSIIADAPRWDLDRATRFARLCADAGVAWLEEPLPMDDYEGLTELTRRSPLPIAGGELHTAGYPELAMMAARRCYSIFQPDAMFTGGIDQTFRLIRLLRDFGLGYTPHTWTNGVGLAVNLHLLAASGFAEETQLEYPLDPPGWVPEARDAMLERPFLHDRGVLAVPDGPGLGIAIDRSALRKHGRRFFAMDRKRLVVSALRERGIKGARAIDAARRARAGRF
ncbi:MAG: mandelate racemase/muconate lactonizing enzyme family protein [Actinomycetota bacterium]